MYDDSDINQGELSNILLVARGEDMDFAMNNTFELVISREQKMVSRLLFGGIVFLVCGFGLGYGLFWPAMTGNIVAGIFAFILLTTPRRFQNWNIFKTGILTCLVLFGFVSLWHIAQSTKPTSKLF